MSGGDPLSRALVRRHVPARLDGAARRASMGVLEGWVGLILNATLFGIKLALGLATGSVALIADAVHTAADSITSGVLIVGSEMCIRDSARGDRWPPGPRWAGSWGWCRTR